MLSGTEEDKFLSEVMGKYCYNVVDLDKNLGPRDGSYLFIPSFGTARIDVVTQSSYVKPLIKQGWDYICAEVEYSIGKGSFLTDVNLFNAVKALNFSKCEILKDKDNFDLSDYFFLHDRFKNSRFHLDEKISHEIPDLIKLRWMENISKRERQCDTLILSQYDTNHPGFTSLFLDPNVPDVFKYGVIDLICVNGCYRNRGIATLMLFEAFKIYNRLNVKTQLKNESANQFYLKCGFKPINHYMVFHKHSS